MITVEPAAHDDIDRLVELESGLFGEDAGRHERLADVTWPEREGRGDFDNSSAVRQRSSSLPVDDLLVDAVNVSRALVL